LELKQVKPIRLIREVSVKEMMAEMMRCGVLGAGRIGLATELVTEMFNDPNYTVFLTLAGPAVPGGLRSIISDLIYKNRVRVIVTTGANMVHDIIESLGYKHVVGSFLAEDEVLKTQGIGRIGDIYIEHEAFHGLEEWMRILLEKIPEKKRQDLAITELLLEAGRQIRDTKSILAAAAKKGVPIISPAFIDSIAGFHVWLFGQERKIRLNPLGDMDKLMDEVYSAKKVGVIILGGGWPKHLALFANTFREGVDCAVQITMDRPEPGGLSGASLEEAISWGKVKPQGKTVMVTCDFTIAFPLIISAALDRVSKTAAHA
jgi:deoxyhypusine synthase